MGEWSTPARASKSRSSASPTTSTSRSSPPPPVREFWRNSPVVRTRTANFRFTSRRCSYEASSQVRSTRAWAAPATVATQRRDRPHNGGSPPCNHTSMGVRRDSFCRQDLIGADYGLLDARRPSLCRITALLWTKTMGRRPRRRRSGGRRRRRRDRPALRSPHRRGRVGGRRRRRLAHCARDQPRERERDAPLSSVGDVARAHVLEGDADARLAHRVGGLLGTGAKFNGRRSAPPPTARRRSSRRRRISGARSPSPTSPRGSWSRVRRGRVRRPVLVNYD